MPNSPEEHDSEFVALLTGHQVALRLYVSSLLPGEPGAADVAQQANATIWGKRADFTLGTNFKAWAFSIARFEVLNFRKRQARDARLVFSAELEDLMAEELPGQVDDLDHRQAALRHCLEDLRAADRELILHRYFRRTTLARYAEEVGRSVGGLKVSLHRIRNSLLRCIEGRLPPAEREAEAPS